MSIAQNLESYYIGLMGLIVHHLIHGELVETLRPIISEMNVARTLLEIKVLWLNHSIDWCGGICRIW
jgi:hypothetical protein